MIEPNPNDIKTFLLSKSKGELIEMITEYYELSNGKQTWYLFNNLMFDVLKQELNIEWLNAYTDAFIRESKKGKYYDAQYDKHFLDISEATDQWINTFQCLIDLSCILIERGESAIEALKKLDELMQYALYEGNVVFASEFGEWMINPKYDYKQYL